jgi:hypothetical protein
LLDFSTSNEKAEHHAAHACSAVSSNLAEQLSPAHFLALLNTLLTVIHAIFQIQFGNYRKLLCVISASRADRVSVRLWRVHPWWRMIEGQIGLEV